VKQGALTYKLPLVGLCKLKVQQNHGPSLFHQKEQKYWKDIKGEERFNKFQKEKLYKRDI
jgi:hypothetical protein